MSPSSLICVAKQTLLLVLHEATDPLDIRTSQVGILVEVFSRLHSSVLIPYTNQVAGSWMWRDVKGVLAGSLVGLCG